MSRALRTIHFVVTAFVGVPLVVWTVTGFAFTCFDFAAVRGTNDRAAQESLPSPPPSIVAPAAAIAAARSRRGDSAQVTQVRLRVLLGRPIYVVELASPADPVLIDAVSGVVREEVDREEAGAIAARAFRGDVHVRSVEVVGAEPDGADFSGPTYRVLLDDAAETQVFVARNGGEIVSWRNRSWRSFDRLWSLHVFGFVSRASPAQWPLRIAGAFAALASLSGAGILLAALWRRLQRKSRRGRPRPGAREASPVQLA